MHGGSGTIGLIVAALVVALFVGVVYVVVNQSVPSVSPVPVAPPPGPNDQEPAPNGPNDPPSPPPPPTTPRDRAGCEAQGGQWGIFGIRGETQCNLPTPDAGKLCLGNAECVTLCVTDEQTPRGTRAQGVCYGWTVIAGTCLNPVEDGKAQGQLCAD